MDPNPRLRKPTRHDLRKMRSLAAEYLSVHPDLLESSPEMREVFWQSVLAMTGSVKAYMRIAPVVLAATTEQETAPVKESVSRAVGDQ